MRFPKPPARTMSTKGADAFLARAREVFPGSYELLRHPPCTYDRHRGREWREPDGRWICGICHPPAMADVEWNGAPP